MTTCATTPTANATVSGDPSGTRSIREEFIKAIRRRFRRLRGAVRKKVGYANDALHLMEDAPGPSANVDDDRDRFDAPTRQSLINQFSEWLEQKAREEILAPVDLPSVGDGEHWTAPHIRAAYAKGWRQATGRLTQEGVSIEPAEDVEAIFQLPVPRRQLRKLYTRTFENLESVSDDIADEVRSTLTEELALGKNPRDMAERLADEISKIEETRALVLARTETLYSHNEAALDRYEDAGVDTVQHGEWATAKDQKVCPICESLDGREFGIPEMREGTFQFAADGDDVPDHLAGEYPLHPPAHPNGRCTIYPVIGAAR